MLTPVTHGEVANIRATVLDLPGWYDAIDSLDAQHYPSGSPIPIEEVADPLRARFGVQADADNGGYWLRASRSTADPGSEPDIVSLHLERRTTDGGLHTMQYDFGVPHLSDVNGRGDAYARLLCPDHTDRILSSFKRSLFRIAERGQRMSSDEIDAMLDKIELGDAPGLTAAIEAAFMTRASGLELPTGQPAPENPPEGMPTEVDPLITSEEIAALAGIARHLRNVR